MKTRQARRLKKKKYDDVSAATTMVKKTENNESYSILRKHFNGKAGAYSYILFVLLYTPCFAAISAISKELSVKWVAFISVYTLIVAWLVSTLFYQFCMMFK